MPGYSMGSVGWDEFEDKTGNERRKRNNEMLQIGTGLAATLLTYKVNMKQADNEADKQKWQQKIDAIGNLEKVQKFVSQRSAAIAQSPMSPQEKAKAMTDLSGIAQRMTIDTPEKAQNLAEIMKDAKTATMDPAQVKSLREAQVMEQYLTKNKGIEFGDSTVMPWQPPQQQTPQQPPQTMPGQAPTAVNPQLAALGGQAPVAPQQPQRAPAPAMRQPAPAQGGMPPQAAAIAPPPGLGDSMANKLMLQSQTVTDSPTGGSTSSVYKAAPLTKQQQQKDDLTKGKSAAIAQATKDRFDDLKGIRNIEGKFRVGMRTLKSMWALQGGPPSPGIGKPIRKVKNFVDEKLGKNPWVSVYKGLAVEMATALAKTAAPSARVGRHLIEQFSKTLPRDNSTYEEARGQMLASFDNALSILEDELEPGEGLPMASKRIAYIRSMAPIIVADIMNEKPYSSEEMDRLQSTMQTYHDQRFHIMNKVGTQELVKVPGDAMNMLDWKQDKYFNENEEWELWRGQPLELRGDLAAEGGA